MSLTRNIYKAARRLYAQIRISWSESLTSFANYAYDTSDPFAHHAAEHDAAATYAYDARLLLTQYRPVTAYDDMGCINRTADNEAQRTTDQTPFAYNMAETNSESVATYTYDDLNTHTPRSAHYEYDPFGNILVSEGAEADDNPFRFSTKYFDAETELSYYGYRYYSAELGRWLNQDPVAEMGGLNLFEFVYNNPLSFGDPDGRDAGSWPWIPGPSPFPGPSIPGPQPPEIALPDPVGPERVSRLTIPKVDICCVLKKVTKANGPGAIVGLQCISCVKQCAAPCAAGGLACAACVAAIPTCNSCTVGVVLGIVACSTFETKCFQCQRIGYRNTPGRRIGSPPSNPYVEQCEYRIGCGKSVYTNVRPGGRCLPINLPRLKQLEVNCP